MIREHEDVRDYLSSVCSQIRARELHKDIRRELESHLEELVLDKEAEGASREEAVDWAIRQMGDPVTVGRELHRIHKPRIHWGLLLGLIAFLGLGVFAMSSIESSYGRLRSGGIGELAFRKMIFIGMGFLGLLAFYFMDYRKLKAWSLFMYGVAAVGMICTILFGSEVNGARSFLALFGISLEWTTISSYLFIAAAAGLLLDWWEQKRRFWLKSIVAFILVPFVLYAIVPSLSTILFYLIGYGSLCGVITRKWWLALLQAGGILLLSGVMAAMASPLYMKNRLSAFVNPVIDPSGAGYMYIQMKAAISSAGWWGHGFGAVNPKLQYIHSELILTYLVYSFGWGVGISVAGAVVYFVARMLHSMGQVRDTYGKMLIVAATSLIGAQFGYCIGMSLGLLPITSVVLPFVSYGGTHIIVEMAIIGLVLGIYRRKDMIRLGRTF